MEILLEMNEIVSLLALSFLTTSYQFFFLFLHTICLLDTTIIFSTAIHSCECRYSKALRYAASRCTDLAVIRFLIGSKTLEMHIFMMIFMENPRISKILEGLTKVIYPKNSKH